MGPRESEDLCDVLPDERDLCSHCSAPPLFTTTGLGGTGQAPWTGMTPLPPADVAAGDALDVIHLLHTGAPCGIPLLGDRLQAFIADTLFPRQARSGRVVSVPESFASSRIVIAFTERANALYERH
ncbi:hypothetical protein T4D_3942 [Trichinella pseudospiralis]|uniref:Uncharacterized protein n=1 Tax=Trichinella pseudospiralis TaxID=6337 RepID=A0A0V1FAB1_TRIPS|nr:hypothetical protein T4D_3942 [Trichinella pseudospiralis]